MSQNLPLFIVMLSVLSPRQADAVEVTGIGAVHRHGQTFITWRDAAHGEAGAEFRYSLYRSAAPITQKTLRKAELVYAGVLNHSGVLFGHAFDPSARLSETTPMTVIQQGGDPLPRWSGLAVRTAREDDRYRSAYYSVVATDLRHNPLSRIIAGESATTVPVKESVAPLWPIKLHDSAAPDRDGGRYKISGNRGLPLTMTLHGSHAEGGTGGDVGDYYLYFGSPNMGWRDGLAGAFSVYEKSGHLYIAGRDAIIHPRPEIGLLDRKWGFETFWFGYAALPPGANHTEPRVYSFTENRMLWVLDWVQKQYATDPQRTYLSGSSMGGYGAFTLALRQPDSFAAAQMGIPTSRRTGLRGSPFQEVDKDSLMLADGETSYADALSYSSMLGSPARELPFLLWSAGRQDSFVDWNETVQLVNRLTKDRRGFAFAWHRGGHTNGGTLQVLHASYPLASFALDRSYPAFTNSSVDDSLEDGAPAEGEFWGINLGFEWNVLRDEPRLWRLRVANHRARGPMTVDVTPRRSQKFQVKPGGEFRWTNTAGGYGEVTADRQGLITVPGLRIPAGESTELTIQASPSTPK